MATSVADPGSGLAHATRRATLVSEIVDLLTEAREAILVAQELVRRLSRDGLLDDGLDPKHVADFLSAARSVDPYAIDREYLYTLLQVVVEEQWALEQDINEAMNATEGASSTHERLDDVVGRLARRHLPEVRPDITLIPGGGNDG